MLAMRSRGGAGFVGFIGFVEFVEFIGFVEFSVLIALVEFVWKKIDRLGFHFAGSVFFLKSPLEKGPSGFSVGGRIKKSSLARFARAHRDRRELFFV